MSQVVYSHQSASVADLVRRLATDVDNPDDPIYIPSLQREFCWDHSQIEALFDSLLRGLPLGALLLWNVKGETAESEATYRFIQHYVEKSAYPTEQKHEKDDRWVRNKSDQFTDDERLANEYTFALDGQQRLTSFLIGLRGTQYRHKYRHKKSLLTSYTERQLHLDILSDPAEREAGAEELLYRFSFKTSGENRTEKGAYWWPVPRIWETDDIKKTIENLRRSLDATPEEERAIERNLLRLHEAVVDDQHLSIEHVSNMGSEIALDLFVRRNDGGKPLKNSDIAFSQMAVYWNLEGQDPKEAIESYVDDLERDWSDFGFGFGKGFILRALLMLSGNPPSFRRENLIPDNIRDLESIWENEAFENAMYEAYRIVTTELGLGRKCVTSNNAILPIIFYCYLNLEGTSDDTVEPPTQILNHIEYWLQVTACNNLFSIGSDTVLREAQRQIDASTFPVLDILENFRGRGIELQVDEARLQTLVEETDYKSGSVKHFLLTKSYPDTRISGVLVDAIPDGESTEVNQYQVDHIFPRNKLKDERALAENGLDESQIQACKQNQHRLGNLQLIPDNPSKSDDDPGDWLRSLLNDGEAIEEIANEHCLPWTDIDQYEYGHFEAFCDEREDALFSRLSEQLVLYEDIVE